MWNKKLRNFSVVCLSTPRYLFFFPTFVPGIYILTKIAVMKTHNQHPVWYNEPMRLNEDQLNDPELTFDDFFQYYHLNEVREILWKWVTEVVSSPRSISINPHDRNDHLFFYEKIEQLVEAAWVMNRGMGPVMGQTSPPHITNEQHLRYSKPVRLIEKAATHPRAVIRQVFSQLLLKDLQEDLLPSWLRVALLNTGSQYGDANSYEVLMEFYEQLLHFVAALHDLAERNQFDDLSAVAGFFQQFPIEYIRRELAGLLEAGIGYEGDYPNGFTPWQAWMTYDNILCLVEAAWQLCKTELVKDSDSTAEPKLIKFFKIV